MKKFFESVVFKRALWTIFFLFIYMLGSKLPLPFLDTDNANFLGGAYAMLAFSTAMLGGNLKSMSLFSVGLSPWMSSMILWQMFSLSKTSGIKNWPIEKQDRWKMVLTFGIALIQALAITLNLPIQSGISQPLALVMNTLLLIAGTFFLVWLSDINSLMGLGGSLVILMASMMAALPQNILTSIQDLKVSSLFLVFLAGMGLVFLFATVIMQRARYRIPVNKMNIHNRFKRYSYLDIMLNPAGGMPFMYAISLVSLPQYFLLLIQMMFPKNTWTALLIQSLSMGQPGWILLYILTLFFLGIAFSFVNISGEQISDKMKKSGEYIYQIYPGTATSRYINHFVFRFAVIGAIYIVIMAGFPMLIVLYDAQYLQLSMIPGLFLILSGMIFNIREEVAALTLNENYKPLFDRKG